jgi:hypothetical protein
MADVAWAAFYNIGTDGYTAMAFDHELLIPRGLVKLTKLQGEFLKAHPHIPARGKYCAEKELLIIDLERAING